MAVDQRKLQLKQPYEALPLDVDFSREIPPGNQEIISSIASAVKWPRKQPNNKTDATGEILFSTVPVIVGVYNTAVRVMIINGTDGYDYQVTVKVVFDAGGKLEDELYIRVRED